MCFTTLQINISSGDIYLMVKGAETAVLGRCIEGDTDITEKHVIQFALVKLKYNNRLKLN